MIFLISANVKRSVLLLLLLLDPKLSIGDVNFLVKKSKEFNIYLYNPYVLSQRDSKPNVPA